ncbi:MAG: HD domain-containing protein [Actinobacteria bacterium]|nr:HD domain-containing protein [Actinomycetota bacterium]MCL5447079.1 HD domain-containing protein [Actinomycetota bacterium]
MRVHALTHDREARERAEEIGLAVGATRAYGAGNRAYSEHPDPERTCFERDRDRIVHSPAFRRLAGKTQVIIFPRDHQRTRLTHALEVAQVATAIARAAGLNVALTEAIALGHDCGHGPGGHACEDALSVFLENGFDHAPWGADVTLSSLNLCHETLDGIRNHSWSRPLPITPEGMVVRWADRCAYCAHDLEDAVKSGITSTDQLPASVSETIGATRPRQLDALIRAVVQCIRANGVIGMSPEPAHALAELRRFNYENIYTRDVSIEQGNSVIAVLRSLVEYFIDHPDRLPANLKELQYQHHAASVLPAPPAATTEDNAAFIHWASVAYVAGMTDRFAFDLAIEYLGWNPLRLPVGIG